MTQQTANNLDTFRLSSIISSRKKGHGLTVFSEDEIGELEKRVFLKRGKPYIKCFVSHVDRQLKPEEIVRQLFAMRLVYHYGYPPERLAVEKSVYFGAGIHEKKADIVVFHKDLEHPYIIVEVKKPTRKDGIQQLKSYCNAEGSPIGIWTNGEGVIVLHREEPNIFSNLSSIPTVNQALIDVIKEPWTIDKLAKENKLAKERLSLKSVILDLEDLVLANAGVDAFDEVFKLIYAKLYDEWAATNQKDRKRRIHFRIYGESPSELYEKINNLFVRATKKWRDVFPPMTRIELQPSHLYTCVSFLQDIKFFNANLQVIDEAFEYLITQVAKGSKGQFFTPRYVIDMCVKMLNPNESEYVIDPAAGSCGFTVHTFFHLWGKESISSPTKEEAEYAGTMIYGIDFDGRAVKIAKAMNLIAGDGKSNVYKLNSLDPKSWSEDGKAAFRKFLTRFQEIDQDIDNQKNFKYFDFDVLMTNPPFAGKIRDQMILRNYQLATKENGRRAFTMSRDVLFLERCLNFLKLGGRMAIILPQGRFNNINDEYIRKYIMEKARILAVVSLHSNTFKPHTGTKTSVLFLQKWDEKLCPKKEDYPIFFAVSERGGKDNSGNYVVKSDNDGRPIVDEHGHLGIDHDLFEIADAFEKFVKKERMSFR
ncbi:MAG: N-6 DNA methylase [Candidatus Bathyarchaeota archaeon]|nr:N-6 DNA methylase [Candidatus Bathyarchaeota archaeon]